MALMRLLTIGLIAAVMVAGCGGPPQFPERPNLRLLLATDRLTEDLEVVQYHMRGMEPATEMTAALADRLETLTGKSNVRFLPSVELKIAYRETWNLTTLLQLTDSLDVSWLGSRGPVITALHLSGAYREGNVSVAGVEFAGIVATFPETTAYELPGGLPPVPVDDLYVVFLHEIGHALGLVDHGIPMVREHTDPSDPCRCHSANPHSVMYSRADNVAYLVAQLKKGGNIPHDFDADDVADIQAFQRANGATVGR